MQSKPQVAAFVNYYLSNVNDMIEETGYFLVSEALLDDSKEAWLKVTGNEKTTEPRYVLPPVDPATYGEEDSLTIAGSSTVYPLSREVAKNFRLL